MRWLLGVLAFLDIGSLAAATPLDTLGDAERDFAAAGLRDGVQKSFLAHFAADAIVLRPFATPAHAWLESHPDRPGKLAWAPQYLGTSAAGDLGVSSGPWRFEGDRDGKHIVAHGHFLSIWRNDARHGWQVVLDHGISHDAKPVAPENAERFALTTTVATAAGYGDDAARRHALEKIDDGLRTSLSGGAAHPYATLSLPDTLWLRDGALPQRSDEPPQPAAQACGCGPRAGLFLSAAGDFGYTVGGAESARDKGVDVRVWKADGDGGWKLLVDLASAVP